MCRMPLQRLLYNVGETRNSTRSTCARRMMSRFRQRQRCPTPREEAQQMKSKLLAAAGVAAVAAAALTGCSGGEPEASCTNKIVNADATQVSVWAWYPAFEGVVDLFNETHDDVQICWTNAGQGNDEYTKFSTALESGSGAPDVIMLESEVLSSFSIRDGLVDLTEYDADDVKGDYSEGAWKDVSS